MITEFNTSLFNRLPEGTRSDLVVHRFGVELLDGDGFVVVRTPANPIFYFGNLIFLEQPNQRSVDDWIALFQNCFSDIPDINHCTLVWNKRDSSVDWNSNLKDKGFQLEDIDVRSVTQSQWQKPEMLFPDELEIRDFNNESDWQQWFDLNLKNRDPAHTETDYIAFLEGQRFTYQRLINEEQGFHSGIFTETGQLVAFAGLYFLNGLGRFQFVFTCPGHRRMGLCKHLLTFMAQRGFMSAEQLIILADEHDHATKLYQNLGFRLMDVESSACRW